MFVLPISTTYKLNSLDINGNGAVEESTTYKADTNTDSIANILLKSANFALGEGLIFTQQANAPKVTLSNAGGWYNKLLMVIDTQNNPTNTLYSVAISSDNFATTLYVQQDGTVGAVLGSEDIQSYTAWGGASGSYILGLSANTTYQLKVQSHRGSSTQSPYGPISSAATIEPSLSFDIDVAPTDTETAPPYTIDIGDIAINTVQQAPDYIWVDLDTNGQNGAVIYMKGTNGSLLTSAGNSIASVTGNLTALTKGYGVQSVSTSQTSLGPLTAIAPYNGTLNNVGIMSTSLTPVYSSIGPIQGGRGQIAIKTKIDAVTEASDNYSETITAIAVPTL